MTDILKQQKKKRAYEAAQAGRFNNFGVIASIQKDIKEAIKPLTAKARELAQNDPICVRYLNLIQDQILGTYGFKFHPHALLSNGKHDVTINKTVKTHFNDWENRATTDKESLALLSRSVLAAVARDGEAIVQIFRGKKFGDYAIRFKQLSNLQLDNDFNVTPQRGNQIVQGIEFNKLEQPAAYHFKREGQRQHQRVLAKNIIHIFRKDFPGQIRGITWLAPVMRDMYQLKEYSFSELVNARIAASTTAFLIPPAGTLDDDDAEIPDANVQQLDPGSALQLPPGYTVEAVTPPAANSFKEYTKIILERIASGLQVSYNSLSSDLSQANFSSMRQGALIERKFFKSTQRWFDEIFYQRVYREFYLMASLTHDDLPAARVPAQFKPPGFEYVDPAKEQKSLELALNNNLKSKSQILDELGEEYEEVLAQIAADNDLEKTYLPKPAPEDI